MSGRDVLFDRARVERLLRELAAELDARGVHGSLFLVGGAAMALAYGRQRLTRDVDAVFEPKTVVYEAARTVARRHNLPDDWLNDGVKGYLHGRDPDATTFMDEPGLSVQIASPRYLFVLKALAARVDRDAKDLVVLYRLCGFRTIDEALAHVEHSALPGLLTPKTDYLLRGLLADEAPAHAPAPSQQAGRQVVRCGSTSTRDGHPCRRRVSSPGERCPQHR